MLVVYVATAKVGNRVPTFRLLDGASGNVFFRASITRAPPSMIPTRC